MYFQTTTRTIQAEHTGQKGSRKSTAYVSISIIINIVWKMPFNIVETVDGRGHKELLAVPETWIQGTSKGINYLMWPNVRRADSLNALLLDDSSMPSNSWERIMCKIKRTGLETIAQANRIIQDMCLVSSTDCSVVHEEKLCKPRKTKQHAFKPDNRFQQMLVEEQPKEESNEAIECLNEDNSIEFEEEEYLEKDETSSEVDQLKLHDSEPANLSTNDRLDRLENTLFIVLSKLNILADKTVITTPELSPSIDERLEKLERAMSTVLAKLDILLDKTVIPVSMRRKRNDIGFQVVSSIEELSILESNLAQPDYFNEVSSWLEHNIWEITPENRMIEILDLIFSKKFLTLCSWTGIGKGKEKVPMMTHKNILELFRLHGSTEEAVVTDKVLARFFMKKLKNATKRAYSKGLRKSTQHKFESV
ncbi:uncharacterized protein LOC121594322 isoform X1 [Anopheles merus]|uniref:uncharacterized protein LOC121594316 isoform X1 n=1 Tax=Anopheles merus TaxID=30066 RepID=UPI001BE4B3C7|nr:uncharacterized protein LOC121594316 isoform X1 [Anopheles merus]XP_041773365.1 uncharacterized protein LOC121594316 isoform X1 [Anopheles merus]XP_041773382.1 uncharacterized protein LOC121594322 isoform X1 [Anopheles merus]